MATCAVVVPLDQHQIGGRSAFIFEKGRGDNDDCLAIHA